MKPVHPFRCGGMVAFVVLVVLAMGASHVQAWGTGGHRAIALIAYDRLTVQAKAAVDRYLPGSSLAAASVYPDTYRSQAPPASSKTPQPGGAWSANLHFVNLPRDATKYLPIYCGNPVDCVVAAVSNYTKRMITEGVRGPLCAFAKGDEPCPLSFLTHFVGDIHQPLHCGYADDKGGNSVTVTFQGKSTNLHSLWDSGMLTRFESNEAQLVAYLKGVIANNPQKVKDWLSAMDPAQWAEESFKIVKADVYNFKVSNSQVSALAETITEQYYAHNMPIIINLLAAAGVRLASLINSAFA